MYEHLLFEIKDSIAYITINNPKSLNALNTATLTELNKCLAQLEKRKDARVVIVTGSGAKAFVAGADISEMVNATSEEGRTMALLADEAFCRLERMPQVSIAAVNGYALGGGCELAMACDIRIAADTAVFGQPECGLGILPGFGGTQRLPRLIGKGRAKELIFTCDRIDAQEVSHWPCQQGGAQGGADGGLRDHGPEDPVQRQLCCDAGEGLRGERHGHGYRKRPADGGHHLRYVLRHPRQGGGNAGISGKTSGAVYGLSLAAGG